MIGPGLYEAFFRGYTRKQWGLDPTRFPASILKRLPLRFNFDEFYFAHPHQAMPERGYTELVAAILDIPRVELRLGARFEDLTEKFAHVVYSGPIDRYFGYSSGGGLPHPGFRGLPGEGRLSGLRRHQLLRRGDPLYPHNGAQALRSLGKGPIEGTIFTANSAGPAVPTTFPIIQSARLTKKPC